MYVLSKVWSNNVAVQEALGVSKVWSITVVGEMTKVPFLRWMVGNLLTGMAR